MTVLPAPLHYRYIRYHILVTGGPCSVEERKFHINILELKAANCAMSNVLHVKGKGFNISSHSHGQHDSPVILNENGVYQKPGVDCDQQKNLAVPFEMKDHDYCQILTSVNECRGRQGIQANQGFQ